MLSASGPSGSRFYSSSGLGTSGLGSSSSADSDNNSLDNEDSLNSADSDIEWQYFDEKSYIEAKAVKPGEDAYVRNKFNQAASDKLPSNRAIPDTRSGQCKARAWGTELPETSVIITFHNEARSTLLRTIVR